MPPQGMQAQPQPLPPRKAAKTHQPAYALDEAYRRLEHTLFWRMYALLAPDPQGLTPLGVSSAINDLLATIDRTYVRMGRPQRRALDNDDRKQLRELAQHLMRGISDLTRRPKARDITIVELGDGDWPLVRKRRAPLSDWDVWTLHIALDTLRRSYAIVTDAERHAQAYTSASYRQYRGYSSYSSPSSGPLCS